MCDKCDVSLCREGAVQWRSPAVGGDAPVPREFHTLTPLTKGRLMLLGGDCPCKLPQSSVSHFSSIKDVTNGLGQQESCRVTP